MADRVYRVSSWAGFLAPTITLGAIFLATLLSPSFSWTYNALSNLGGTLTEAGTPTTRLVFNGGLVGGGLIGFGFAYALLSVARNRVELAGIGIFGLDLVSLVLIGVFPEQEPLHIPVAIAFYVLLSVALVTYGAGNLLAGDRPRGLVTIVLGVFNNCIWLLWVATGDIIRPGIAIPEILGAFVFAGWALATTVDVRRRAGITDGTTVLSRIQSR